MFGDETIAQPGPVLPVPEAVCARDDCAAFLSAFLVDIFPAKASEEKETTTNKRAIMERINARIVRA